MISASSATITILSVGLFLLVLIPLLDGSKRFYKYISLRYTLVSVVLIMALGCVLDFSHLAESSRNIVLWGGVLLTGLFVVVRTLEKINLKNKQLNIEVHKGDLGASVDINHKDNK